MIWGKIFIVSNGNFKKKFHYSHRDLKLKLSKKGIRFNWESVTCNGAFLINWITQKTREREREL